MIEKVNPDALPENDVLVSFEITNLPDHFKRNYQIKRQNFFASIQSFPPIWECFMLLDKIWLRELEDFANVNGTEQMLPLVLFMNAHATTRIALELAFSTCMTEAFSIMRDAAESAAFARKVLAEPSLVQVWLEKDHGKQQADEFQKRFVRDRKAQLFQGLDGLHNVWTQFSEIGSHTTLQSLIQKFRITETPAYVQWSVNYTGMTDEKTLAGSLFLLLVGVFETEQVMFAAFRARLQLDVDLTRMRIQFKREIERCRRYIVSRYKIAPPGTTP